MAARIVQWVEKNGAGKGSKKGKSRKKAAESESERTEARQENESEKVEAEPGLYKILVITGGFHTPGILERLRKKAGQRQRRQSKSFRRKRTKIRVYT